MESKEILVESQGQTITIIVSPEQYLKLIELNNWSIILRRQKRKKNTTDLLTPIVKYKKGDSVVRRNLGNYLYSDYNGRWPDSIWKEQQWDYRPENLNIEDNDTFWCIIHKDRLPLEKQKIKGVCSDCWYLRELLRYAQGRVNDKKRKIHINVYELTIDMFLNQKHCAMTGIPLRFKPNEPLYGASLDRIDSKKGYTPENTRLVCNGVNQMKSLLSDKYFINYVKEFNKGKAGRRDLTDKDINLILRKRKTIGKNAIRLMWERTRGICSITGVNMKIGTDNNWGLYQASIDRINNEQGYTEENIQIVSLGANRLRGAKVGNKEAKDFASKIQKLIITNKE